MSRWLAEGRTLGVSLRRFHAVVIAGGDADATADVALGIAQSQAEVRHVVLGDLSANAARFGSLLSDEDPHGLVDAFDYGISLARVARPVEGHEHLQFAPTGSVAPDYPELLAHPRWAKLRTAFTDSGSLLVIVLPVAAAGIEDLVRHTDGLILVDAMTPARIEPAQVIATVVLKPIALPRPPEVSPMQPVPASPPTPTPEPPPAPTRKPTPTLTPASTPKAKPAPTRTPTPARETGVFTAFAKPAGYGAGLSILAAFIVFWFLNSPFSSEREPRTVIPGQPPQAAPPAGTPALPPPDPNLPDPADSGAAAYAVRLLSANTLAGAILNRDRFGVSMPAVTWAPVEKSGTTWYEVLTGAFTTRGGADSLLTSLKTAGILDSTAHGVVVRVPYAVLIDSVRKSATVPDLVTSLRMRQLPVYALEQRNGWVWIVAGAFENRPAADSYSEKIRTPGQPADVVLRQGRMF